VSSRLDLRGLPRSWAVLLQRLALGPPLPPKKMLPFVLAGFARTAARPREQLEKATWYLIASSRRVNYADVLYKYCIQ
jgi:hypothetical protein